MRDALLAEARNFEAKPRANPYDATVGLHDVKAHRAVFYGANGILVQLLAERFSEVWGALGTRRNARVKDRALYIGWWFDRHVLTLRRKPRDVQRSADTGMSESHWCSLPFRRLNQLWGSWENQVS